MNQAQQTNKSAGLDLYRLFAYALLIISSCRALARSAPVGDRKRGT